MAKFRAVNTGGTVQLMQIIKTVVIVATGDTKMHVHVR